MRTPRLALITLFALFPLTAAAQQPAGDETPAPAAPRTSDQAPAQTQAPAPAQVPAQPQAPAAVQAATPDTPSEYVPATKNVLDFGVRGTSITGDTARYERYRDMGNGAYLQTLRFERERNRWLFTAAGDNVGRNDQRLGGSFGQPGRFKAWGLWDRIPMMMSRSTETLFVEDPTKAPPVLTISDAIQTQVQANPAALQSLFDANATTFETRSLRQIGQTGFNYLAHPDFTLHTQLQVTTRKGSLPYGGSFGHSSLVEMPAPIDHKLTDFETNGEFARGDVLLRGGVTGSWFHNNNTTVTFDNPFRATDLTATPSRGRSSLAPNNSFIGVNGLASVKLRGHSRATAYFSMGSLKDGGDALMPQTINSVNLPAVVALPRSTVDGEAHTGAMNFTFITRPNQHVDVDARYRYYDYDNRTPEFVLPQRVAYDNTPGAATFSTLGGAVSPLVVETEPFGINRKTFDVNMRLRPSASSGAVSIGYSWLGEDRKHRFFESTTENVFRTTYDLVGTGPFTLRSKYEHGQKRGDVTDEAQQELFNIGEQPFMRQFDIASRDRDRVTILGSVAAKAVALSGSIAAGKDDYVESSFGLRDNKHRIYSTAIDVSPTETVAYGGSYSYERYDALQRSRQANPPSSTSTISYETFLQLSAQPGPLTSNQQIADATRNWGSDGADRVHSVLAHLDVMGLREKVDLHFTFDYNRSRSLYTYTTGPDVPRTLPDEAVPPASTLPPPTQLPLNKSDLTRGTVEVVYALTKKLGIGLTYWYEDWKVEDWTLDIEANPQLARGQALLMGYLYRPYTANTVFGRLVYRW